MQSDIKADITATHSIIKGSMPHGNYSLIYPFTNENLREYLLMFDIKDKDVLTVTASGDHPLNMVLQGAKKITSFDINKLAYYWLELKKAGVLTLSLDEFKEFFLGEMRKEKYRKISSALEKDTKDYWGEIIETYPPIIPLGSGELFKKSHFAIGRRENSPRSLYQKSNRYLSDNFEYDDLRKKLSNLQMDFINCNIFDLPQETSEKFNAIFTSNISGYVDKDKYKNFVESALIKMLQKDGLAQVSHSYNGDDEYSTIFNGANYEKKYFQSLKNPLENGNVISLRNV